MRNFHCFLRIGSAGSESDTGRAKCALEFRDADILLLIILWVTAFSFVFSPSIFVIQ